jgi:hypothetical protein
MTPWTAEAQATLAEEIVGYAIEGRASGQNLGFAVAFNEDDPSSTDWFRNRFVDLFRYFGFESATSRVTGAPSECSWLDGKPRNPGPCLGGRDIYGVPWSLLRWITDRFGPSFPGGEAGLQRALINSTASGYDNLEQVLGVPINSILARWSAALYVDDRVPGADPDLTMPSWNFHEIFGEDRVESARLVPESHGFEPFGSTFRVRGGSTAYLRVSGATHASTAIRIRNTSDNPLPSDMQVFVVRLR